MPRAKPRSTVIRTSLVKAPTGIQGLDELTGGGLPKDRVSLVCGKAGCGKSLLGMEFQVHGAVEFGEPGVCINFEETEDKLIAKSHHLASTCVEDARKIADVKAQGRRLRAITTKAIDEVGRLARGLHPTVLDDHGIGIALTRYVTEYAETYKIKVDLVLGDLDSDNLSSTVQITLYRIIQEATDKHREALGSQGGQHSIH
jgi:hypothetical protein